MSAKPSLPHKHDLRATAVEQSTQYSPSEFMRARRPHLFSDSISGNEPNLAKEVFEFHLETLTKRKQEIEFEHFARKLAEKEICPNLIPQTGPTGGGDSKVDTETYPVSDEIALLWYVGIGNKASQERWAFAFSAKKDWQSKIKSDVEKIVATDRGYRLIYFITNQYVEDRKRAKVEDELTKKFGVNVRILDRSWIVECIFEHGRLQLAIDTLNITGYGHAMSKTLGPHDAERQEELRLLEQQIEDPDRYQGVYYQLAEDCLQAALLARGLELSRVEVEGRFDRAERVAQKVNRRQQQLRITYNRAWTLHWWYEDFEAFNQLYAQVEHFVMETNQATDLELLANLWQLLHTNVQRKVLDENQAQIKERTQRLKKALERLASDASRPNNALQSRTNLLLVELTEAITSEKPLKPILSGLKDVLRKSGGLAEFPVSSVMDIIRELGDVLADNLDYDNLFDVVVDVTEKRVSQGEAGIALYERGFQKLKAGKTYDAIRLLGRAQHRLALHEYRREWIASVAGCGVAYEAAGLLWAARANIMLAASFAISEYWRNGEFIPPLLRLSQKMVWLELQLGRVPQILSWMDYAQLIAPQVIREQDQKDSFEQERKTQDVVLGMLLVKSDLWDLKWLDFLPGVLDKQGLVMSWYALLYSLGYEDYLRSEGVIPNEESQEAVKNLFLELLKQPANNDIPDKPNLILGEKVTFKSFVLGCEVVVDVTNNDTSIMLAEIILGAIEALLATSLDEQIFPYRSKLFLRIQPTDFISGMPEFIADEETGGEIITIRHAKNLFGIIASDRLAFHKWLKQIIVNIALQIIVVQDPVSFTKRIFRDEQGLERAINFSDIDIAIGNIFGDTPKIQLSDWKPKESEQTFPLLRDQSWNFGLEPKILKQTEVQQVKFGVGEPPESLFGVDNLKHKDRRIVSLINVPLWDKAKWLATAYICFPNTLPILALGFANADAAKRIFAGLKEQIGEIDKNEQLRVSVIKGVNQKHPANYRVVISTNLDKLGISDNTQLLVLSRVHQMEPPDLVNLNNFLERYKQTGKYVILPACFVSESTFPEPVWELGIVKQELIVRDAWQVGQHDLDVVAIHENDIPIIPKDVTDAPVIQALQRFKGYKKRKKH